MILVIQKTRLVAVTECTSRKMKLVRNTKANSLLKAGDKRC